MVREIALISVVVLISLLIVVKGDQQIVILLEGKLFKQDRDMSIAKSVYRKHKSALSVIFFMIGGAAMGISVILLANGHRLFSLSVAITVALFGLGIWGRLSSFRAADRELDAQGNGSSGSFTKAR